MHAKLEMPFGHSCHLVYKHKITGKYRRKEQPIYSIFPPATWALWHEVQQNHFRRALKVTDILFLIAFRVELNERYRLAFLARINIIC